MARAATRRKPRPSGRTTGGSGSAQAPRRLPGWLLLGLGVIVGASLSPGYRWLTTPQGGGANSPLAGQAPSDGSGRINFKFYDLLPQRDIEATPRRSTARPDAAAPTPPPTAKPAPARKKPAESATAPRYYVQAGSFRRPAEAEKRRIELLLLDLESEISRVTSKGDTWYRLQLGPFQSNTEVAGIRSKLQDEGIETLVIRRQGG